MAVSRVFLLLCLLSLACAGPRRWKKLSLRSPLLPRDTAVAEAQWFKEQKLDHFSETDNRTWEQRFFVNDTLWDRGSGPVFLMLGGEGPADPAWLATDTDIMRNAAKFNAIVISLEHRLEFPLLFRDQLTCDCVQVLWREPPYGRYLPLQPGLPLQQTGSERCCHIQTVRCQSVQDD